MLLSSYEQPEGAESLGDEILLEDHHPPPQLLRLRSVNQRVTTGRAMMVLFAASLGLRLLVCVAVIRTDVPLLYDEADYFDRALAFRELYVGFLGGDAPSEETWSRAYGGGHWPPLHPMAMATGLAIFGPNIAVARLLNVVISALTTSLIFGMTLTLSNSRAAWAAALLHLVYPTFVAYSHYLWSETTAIALGVSGISLAVATAECRPGRRKIARATLTGVVCGLGALTRPAALPMVFVIPLWLAYSAREWRSRRSTAAIALAAGLAMLLPWAAMASSREKTLVPLSTLGGYNLALGNNPWVPAGYGSSWGHEESKASLHARLQDVAQRNSIGWETAAYLVAWEEVRKKPRLFLTRVRERLQMLWSPDFFPLRHLFSAVYPPLPKLLTGLLAGLSIACYFGLMILTFLGLFDRRLSHRGLLLSVLATGLVLPALTFGMSRLHLPLLALLLPAAGSGLTQILPQKTSQPGGTRPRTVALLIGLLFSSIAASTVPKVARTYLQPSSYYASVFESLPRAEVTYSDRLHFRLAEGSHDSITLRIIPTTARFENGGRELRWRPTLDHPELDVRILSHDRQPLEIEITSVDTGTQQRLHPVSRMSWRTWRVTDIPNLEIQWVGGGLAPPNGSHALRYTGAQAGSNQASRRPNLVDKAAPTPMKVARLQVQIPTQGMNLSAPRTKSP